MNYSVIIPVYNSANCIVNLVTKIVAVFDGLNASFEIILVDDFSQDNSWEQIKHIVEKYPDHIKAIRLSRNFGQHNATFCGIQHAKGEYCITMDDDFQHAPEDILKLIEAKTDSIEVLYASFRNKKHSWKRLFYRFAIKTLGIVRLLSSDYKELSSFRLFDRRIRENILNCHSSDVNIDELIRWNTEAIEQINLAHHPSQKTKSGYTFNSLFKYSFHSIFNTSDLPLIVLSRLGFSIMIGSFLFACYFLGKKILYKVPVQGYTSLIVTLLLSTGLIMYTLSFIALYLSKMYRNQKNKPIYSKKEEL